MYQMLLLISRLGNCQGIQTLQLESVGQPIDQEPPKNDFFILEDFWPFFKLLEILGLFPCSKEINEKGAVQLKPIRWWIPIMKVLGLSTLLVLPKAILQRHLISSSKEVSDYFIDFGARLFWVESRLNYQKK